jgi:signal transduction histidine kinase
MANAFAGVVDSLRADIANSQAQVTSGELPTRVRTNRALISQILQNLIANAIKYQRDKLAVVHVSAQRRVDAWEFSVRDNGMGIDPADHERVFCLFERVTTHASGTGVGLALCKRAVEKLGGRIWLASVLGEGTTFYFTVPDSTKRGA